MGSEVHRTFALGFGVQDIDGLQVDHVGGTPEVADAPLDRALPEAEEDPVVEVEIGEEFEDSYIGYFYRRRSRVGGFGAEGKRQAGLYRTVGPEILGGAGVEVEG